MTTQDAESVVAEALISSPHHGYLNEDWSEELARIAVEALRSAGLLNEEAR